VLAVVEHDQQVGVVQSCEELLGQWGARLFPDVEDVGDLSIDQCSLGQCGEVDEEDTVGRLAKGSPCSLDGQPGFSDSAHAAEGHEAARAQEPIDVGELGLAADEARDRGGEVVSFLRRSGRRDLVAKDRLFEALQLLAGLEAKFFVEELARASVRGERVGLALRSIQGEHQLTPQPFAVRVVANKPLQLVDQLGILAEREVCLDPIFEHGDAKILQALGLRPQGSFVADPREGMTPPELQGLAQPRCRAARCSAFNGLMPLFREPLETGRVHVVARDVERIARPSACDRGICTQHRAELGDIGAQRRRGPVGRLAMPELVG
jgi:hypothetical protein